MNNSVSTDSPANLAKTAKITRGSTQSLFTALTGEAISTPAPSTSIQTDPEEIEERAAIFEFDSGIPRPVAEWLAHIWFFGATTKYVTRDMAGIFEHSHRVCGALE
ncbi:MAG: hypothetical protein HQL67_08365 [Magnetococcales bacterium]|nr:hypothetical protein [Magnetococcales bacterium]